LQEEQHSFKKFVFVLVCAFLFGVAGLIIVFFLFLFYFSCFMLQATTTPTNPAVVAAAAAGLSSGVGMTTTSVTNMTQPREEQEDKSGMNIKNIKKNNNSGCSMEQVVESSLTVRARPASPADNDVVVVEQQQHNVAATTSSATSSTLNQATSAQSVSDGTTNTDEPPLETATSKQVSAVTETDEPLETVLPSHKEEEEKEGSSPLTEERTFRVIVTCRDDDSGGGGGEGRSSSSTSSSSSNNSNDLPLLDAIMIPPTAFLLASADPQSTSTLSFSSRFLFDNGENDGYHDESKSKDEKEHEEKPPPTTRRISARAKAVEQRKRQSQQLQQEEEATMKRKAAPITMALNSIDGIETRNRSKRQKTNVQHDIGCSTIESTATVSTATATASTTTTTTTTSSDDGSSTNDDIRRTSGRSKRPPCHYTDGAYDHDKLGDSKNNSNYDHHNHVTEIMPPVQQQQPQQQQQQQPSKRSTFREDKKARRRRRDRERRQRIRELLLQSNNNNNNDNTTTTLPPRPTQPKLLQQRPSRKALREEKLARRRIRDRERRERDRLLLLNSSNSNNTVSSLSAVLVQARDAFGRFLPLGSVAAVSTATLSRNRRNRSNRSINSSSSALTSFASATPTITSSSNSRNRNRSATTTNTLNTANNGVVNRLRQPANSHSSPRHKPNTLLTSRLVEEYKQLASRGVVEAIYFGATMTSARAAMETKLQSVQQQIREIIGNNSSNPADWIVQQEQKDLKKNLLLFRRFEEQERLERYKEQHADDKIRLVLLHQPVTSKKREHYRLVQKLISQPVHFVQGSSSSRTRSVGVMSSACPMGNECIVCAAGLLPPQLHKSSKQLVPVGGGVGEVEKSDKSSMLAVPTFRKVNLYDLDPNDDDDEEEENEDDAEDDADGSHDDNGGSTSRKRRRRRGGAPSGHLQLSRRKQDMLHKLENTALALLELSRDMDFVEEEYNRNAQNNVVLLASDIDSIEDGTVSTASAKRIRKHKRTR
jgi:hypothetical protein